jgi:hypothetical protein
MGRDQEWPTTRNQAATPRADAPDDGPVGAEAQEGRAGAAADAAWARSASGRAVHSLRGLPGSDQPTGTTGGWYCNSCWAKWDGGGGGGGATTAASAQPHNPQAQYQQALARVQEEEATKAAAEARILGLCFLGWTMNVPASYMHGGGRLIAGGGW